MHHSDPSSHPPPAPPIVYPVATEKLDRKRSPSTSRSPSTFGGKPETLSDGTEAEAQLRRKGKVERHADAIVEEVFLPAEEGDVNFKGLGWKGAVVLLVKTQVGLGVLALPSTLNVLGLVPGLLVFLALGLITTYGDYVLGQFQVLYPGCHNVGDVGYLFAGSIGREVMGWGFLIFMLFNTGAGMLTFSVAMNAITEHATCTVVFALIAAVIIMAGNMFRTLKGISILGWTGISFIVPAILIVTIAVGVSDRPPSAPPGPFDKELRAFGDPTFAEAMGAVLNVLFAWSGSVGFLSVIAELRRPEHYFRAVYCCQAFCFAFYTAVSIVLWYFSGKYIASPALGSAGPLLKKVAYGLAIPGLLAGPIIYIHLAIKFAFVRILRGTIHLQKPTSVHWTTWISLVVALTSISFIIASSIPFFNSLIGLIAALFCSLYCVIMLGYMWLFINIRGDRTFKWKFLFVVNCFIILVGLFLLGAGMWASVISIRDQFDTGNIGQPFSCADNSI